MKTGSRLAILLFTLVAVAHLLRLALDIQVTIGGAVAPMWISVVGVLVPAAVAWQLWKEGRAAG